MARVRRDGDDQVLSRASQLLMLGGAGFDPVWEPPGK
jgi:hypothetical protein